MVMKYDVDGLHYWAPQKKICGGWICHKDSPQAPTPPDPKVTAGAQTASNIDTANANAILNRVNQNTPWGSLTYNRTPGQNTFDQGSYDAALAKYNQQLSQPTNSYQNRDREDGGGNAPPVTQNIAAPNRADFYGKPGVDTWSSTINLSPEQQKLLDSSNKISQSMADLGQSQIGNVSNTLGKPLSFDGAPRQVNSVQGGNIQGDIDMNGVPALVGGDKLADDLNTQRDSLYKQQAGYLDPQWSQDQHDLENKLVQQGVMQNSDAWNRAVDDFGRNKEFAYRQARESAITGGGNEQSRLFGLGLAANQNAYGQASNNAAFHNSAQGQGFNQGLMNANLANQGRAQNINELMALRQNPLNELNALRSGSQVTSPTFGNVPGANVAGTDVVGPINNAYNAQMGAYNAQVAQNNSLMGGLFGLGAAAIGAPVGTFSDIRLKENIKRVGYLDNGLPVYTYTYKGDNTPQMGAMAHEVEKINPEAVTEHPSGYKMVRYDLVG